MENTVNENKNVADEASVASGAESRITTEDIKDLDDEFNHPDDCLPDDRKDLVDEALDSVIGTLADAGYEDESAIEAVFDAMELLIEENIIEVTPDLDVADDIKKDWIDKTIPKIKERLKVMGLEF
jgi:hypothetical protein